MEIQDASPRDRLKLLINSGSPLVLIETVEELRALELVRGAALDLQLPVFEWSVADGLVRYEKKLKTPAPANYQVQDFLAPITQNEVNIASGAGAILNTMEPAGVLAHIMTMTIDAVFVLKDFHRHLDSAMVSRRLREVAESSLEGRRTLIITAPSVELPPELQSQVEYLSLPLPDGNRLKQIVEECFTRLSKKMTLKRKVAPSDLDATASNMRGLTEEEAERAIAQAMVGAYGLTAEIASDVLHAKKEILRRSGMLEFIDCDESMAAVGGLENLKKWLSRRRGTWEPAARAAGLEPPRGVIILGVQGCGKSMCARAIAGEWCLPLVKFDTAAIYDKFVGETEKHIHKMFAVAEQLAPAVLWIDELEKVFAGSGPDSASVDAGVSSRLLGAFLGWMQDRKAPVFVAATCNNVMVLPPELIRKGRFDELFFVDLPNSTERRAIFQVQLTRHKQNAGDFALERLVAASHGYSGAEIEAAIKSAMYTAFADKKFMSTDLVLAELAATVPLSATRAEDIANLRAWAQERAVQASYPESAEASA
ncbi:MAG TPA: AAA family ATPase [Candidatus Angelobacter sp.]|nr:AAA family ATPase [Candidatus Angelobacter sp.]